MLLPEMVSALRTELQDEVAGSYIWGEDELVRAIRKSTSLMSRLIPKRSMVETTIVRDINDEALTIASDTGTLAYKPIKVGSVVVTGEVLDTDYRINYLTGVITEIGSLLADGAYTVSYDLDPHMLDMSSLLSDYIKVERVEYPAGDEPITLPTFDIIGDFLILRGNVTLVENDHLRMLYLGRWTAPTPIAVGDYPSHLDDTIIIGGAGQALIFKAEAHTQTAITCIALSKTTLDDIVAVTMATAPIITTETGDADTALDAAAARFAVAVTEADKIDTPLANAATALGKIAAEVVVAKGYLTTGAALINVGTRGEQVGRTYGDYSLAASGVADGYGKEAERDVALANSWEARAARETTIGNSYVNEAIQRLASASRLIDKYQQELAGDSTEVNYYRAQLEKAANYQTTARQYLEIAGRYLASGQSKINEFLVSLGLKPEFPTQKASSEQRA